MDFGIIVVKPIDVLFMLKFLFQQTHTLTNDTCLHFVLLPSEPEWGNYPTERQTSYALSCGKKLRK